MDVERAWLELVADLTARPLRVFPAEPVAVRLIATFAARGCAYRARGRERVWGWVDDGCATSLTLPLRDEPGYAGFLLAREASAAARPSARTPTGRSSTRLIDVLSRLKAGDSGLCGLVLQP